MTNTRLARLREIIAAQPYEALLITQAENRRYLSGFTGDTGVLVVDLTQTFLATDFRYYEQVRQEAPDVQLVQVTGTTADALADLVRQKGYRVLGFEPHAVTVQTYGQWREAMPEIEWVPTEEVVEGLRAVKEEGELAAIVEAVRIADEAMAHVVEWLRPGMTERQVAWEIEVYMRTHGAERLSFPTIVAAGPNGAMAHAVPGDRPIQAGDPIVIDTGCVYNGYCSDLTRSFCLGRADDDYLAIWNTVLEAQLAAEEAIHAGMSGVEADAVARRIIYDAGYENKFGHGLGHGVGLAIHENPRASFLAKGTLPAGSVLTVEPGIYIPGWGGVRIEDMVVVKEGGCRILTGAPKMPLIGAAQS
ncbi:MAG: aminopeptidase P family protein [Chloroflexi bacterium]|nr:aminopeptidase P family protein [Chloroflexota bacterium]